MKLAVERYPIRLLRPFRIAHGTSDTRETILVTLTDGGLVARGEGALPPYYPSRAEDCVRWLEGLDVSGGMSIDRIPAAPVEAAAGRVALEIALHDLRGQREEAALWRLWGLDWQDVPACARTISIPTSREELRALLNEGGGKSFKLKLGAGDPRWDLEIVRLSRECRPEARLSVDVNGGWEVNQAAELIPQIARHGLEYIEQPVTGGVAEWRALREALSGWNGVPLVADESLQNADDLPMFQGLADGVNVKLLKAGGLAPARRWIETARAHDLGVMIGVMVETGIGRTAAAQLAPLANWLDIDPPDSIPVDPFSGFDVYGDRLMISAGAGLGLTPASARR